jgi:hypothetical protein
MNRRYTYALGLVMIADVVGCSGAMGPDSPRSIEQGLCQNDPNDPCCPGSPIILDLEGDGFDLTDAAGGVHFNLNPAGDTEQLSWTAPKSDDAWLALDRNGNGVIDDGTELFGNFTPQPSSDSLQGYKALAVLDLNHDRFIDSKDAIFGDLRLWQDRNHDGVSDPDELSTLDAHGILGLDVRFTGARETDEHGNLFRYSAKVVRAADSTVGPLSYDVFLITQRLDQRAREEGAVQSNGEVSLASLEPDPSCPDGGGDPVPTAKWTCDATCNLMQTNPGNDCSGPDGDGRVRGTGTASSSRAACTAAEKDANSKVPAGCYKRHCHCDCTKGSDHTTYDDDFMMAIIHG